MAVDKTMTPQEVVKQIKNGDTIAIGGWGPMRKPMAIVREIAKSKLKDLTIISFAALDADMLIGAGKVKKLVFPFMSLEGVPGKLGNYSRSRKEGNTIELMELSEYMTIAGLKAAAARLPFFPTRSGLGTDLLKVNPGIVTFNAPYTGEKLVAMPALKPNVTLIHVNAATRDGYGQILGDPRFDRIMARAADKTFLCAERIVPMATLKKDFRTIEITKVWVHGVVEAPNGAHPGSAYPEYTPDANHLSEYSKASAEAATFKEYLDKYINVPDQKAYLKLVGKA